MNNSSRAVVSKSEKIFKNAVPRKWKAVVGVVFLLATIGFYFLDQNTQTQTPPTPTNTPTPTIVDGQVVKVVDGDTLSVQIEGQPVTIRLIGVDTPEVVDPRKPVQCFGRQASDRAHVLADNQVVKLQADATQDDRDKYGRLLRYVILSDGRMLNKILIAEGFAHEYTYQAAYQYQAEFKQAQQDAQVNQAGLWAPSTCNGITS